MRRVKYLIRTAVVALVAGTPIASLHAAEQEAALDNWPQWRGPLGTGAAVDANPPIEWSDTKNVKWKVKVPGAGDSTPVIWGNKIFLTAAINTGKKAETATEEAASEEPQERPRRQGRRGRGGRGRGGFGISRPTDVHQFVLICLNRKTGETLWQKTAREELPHEGHHSDHGFASHSPVTDGKHVFAYFGSRGLHCYDLDGNKIWEKQLGKMRTRVSFGEGSSPALFGDTIVVNWDHEGEDFIVAFNKNTGEELWRQSRDESTTWATPIIVQHDGKPQVVTAATNRVRSYDLATGEQVWESEGLTPNAIPTPVSADGIVYVTSGFRGSKLFAIRLGHTGDISDTEAVLWKHSKQTPYVPSPLLNNDRLYFTASNRGVISCFNAKTGEAIYGPERIEGLRSLYASPIAAGGKIYIVARNGDAVVIQDGEKPEVIATNKLGEDVDASPVALGNELFIRGTEHLFCISK